MIDLNSIRSIDFASAPRQLRPIVETLCKELSDATRLAASHSTAGEIAEPMRHESHEATIASMIRRAPMGHLVGAVQHLLSPSAAQFEGHETSVRIGLEELIGAAMLFPGEPVSAAYLVERVPMFRPHVDRLRRIGHALGEFPDRLVAEFLDENRQGFDGVPMFGDHPVNPISARAYNNDWPDLALDPYSLADLLRATRDRQLEIGPLLRSRPALIIPPALDAVAAHAMRQVGGTKTRVIVLPHLRHPRAWFVAELGHAVKPIVMQTWVPFALYLEQRDWSMFLGGRGRIGAFSTIPALLSRAGSGLE